MKNIGKKIAITLLTLTLLTTSFTLFGCTEEPKKYDIAIKVLCLNVENNNVVHEWIFDPNMSVIEIDFDYDGTAYRFVADSYKYLNHPTIEEKWKKTGKVNPFLTKLTRQGEDIRVTYIRNKGKYEFYVDTTTSPNDMNFRSVLLKITIK